MFDLIHHPRLFKSFLDCVAIHRYDSTTEKKGHRPPAGAKETHAEVRDDMGDDDYLSISMFVNES